MKKDLWFKETSLFMRDSLTVIQKVVGELSEDSEVFYDIHCSDPFDAEKEYVFPVVVLNHFGAYPFVLVEGHDVCSESFETFEYILSVFKSYFCIKQKIDGLFILIKSEGLLETDDEHSFVQQKTFVKEKDSCFSVYAYKRDFTGFANVQKELVKKVTVQEIVDMISKETNIVSDEDWFDTEEYENLSLKLSKESSEALESDLTPENCFVKKNGRWLPAFTQDPDKVFSLALFGGFVGLHRFYLKMFGTGILYLFTLGGFGIGWFFDCLEILLGHWRKNGKVLLPLEDKKKCVMKMLFVFGFVSVAIISLWSIN